MRWRRNGDAGPAAIGISGPLNVNWRGDGAAYATVHNRLMRERGPARLHPCAECGTPAAEWFYDKVDPAGRVSPDGLPYSTDLGRYRPLCKPCHTYADMPGSSSRPHIAQRRELVRAELDRDPGRSDGEIGRLAGADHTTVARIRRAVADGGT